MPKMSPTIYEKPQCDVVNLKNLRDYKSGKNKVTWEFPFSTYGKFSEKLIFHAPVIRTRTCVYQGVKKISFSENFAHVLNG